MFNEPQSEKYARTAESAGEDQAAVHEMEMLADILACIFAESERASTMGTLDNDQQAA